MSRAYRQKYIQTFKEADQDGDGSISQADFAEVLKKLGRQNTDANKVFKKFDEDGSGLINQDEFLIFMEDLDNAWIRVQQKTFTRWADNVLSNRMLKCENIGTDLRSGVLLGPLLEILTSKPVGKLNPNPRMKLNKIENLQRCLVFVQKDGLKLVNVGAEDLEEGNLKITLGFVWSLILKYQIGDGVEEGSPKWQLLEWVRSQCAPYGIGQDLKNFKDGWSDGKVFSALTDSLGPVQNGTIDTTALSGDPYEDSKVAFVTALEKWKIPKLLDAEDVVEHPDEHSILTYCAFFRDWADNQVKQAAASHTTASGPGVEGGDATQPTAEFVVTCKNGQGKPVTTGGDAIGVKILGPKGEEVKYELTDNANGTYTGVYSLSGPGDYVVEILLRNDPIVGSVFTAHMEAGNPGRSYAEGEGLVRGKTNRPCDFIIYSVDGKGNRVPKGRDPFEVNITGPSGPVVAQVTDKGDGTYPVVYAPKEAGDYKIDITLHGQPIKGNPYTASIKRAPNAAKSFVDGPGLKRTYDNKPTYFTIHAVDDVGSPLSGDEAKVVIRPADPNSGLADIETKVTDNGDGTYTVDYAAPQAGKFTAFVTLDGADVQGTPAPINVRVGAAANKTGGAKFNVTIVARDKDGNNKAEGGDDWEVDIVDVNGNHVHVDTRDHGDGSYSCNYQLAAAAGEAVEYRVSMKLGGEEIQGSPFKQFM